MSWVKLDDSFPEHPKVLAAGPAAGWMHVCGLCYCNRNLTDGFVPKVVARTLGTRTALNKLVSLSMWIEVENGYQIHDYLEYQPSRQEVLELREKRAAAGRFGGLRTQAKRQASAAASATKQNSSNGSTAPGPSRTQPVSPGLEEVHGEEPEEQEAPLAFTNLEPAAELEVLRIIASTTGKDSGSEQVIRHFAAQLPLGSLVSVRETAEGKPVQYAVAALKTQLRQLGERRTA